MGFFEVVEEDELSGRQNSFLPEVYSSTFCTSVSFQLSKLAYSCCWSVSKTGLEPELHPTLPLSAPIPSPSPTTRSPNPSHLHPAREVNPSSSSTNPPHLLQIHQNKTNFQVLLNMRNWFGGMDEDWFNVIIPDAWDLEALFGTMFTIHPSSPNPIVSIFPNPNSSITKLYHCVDRYQCC